MPSGREITGLNFVDFLNKGRSYVRAYRNKWRPGENGKKGQSRTGEQHHVGALRPDGTVVIGKKFLTKFPAFENKQWKFVDRDLLEIASDAIEPQLVDSEPEIELEPEPTTKHFLAVWALSGLAQNIGILQALEEVFDRAFAQQMMALAQYYLIEKDASAQGFIHWARYRKMSSHVERLTGQRISELYASVTLEKFEQFWARRFECLVERTGADGLRFCAFDSTSIGTFSASICDAEWGKAKQDPELKQVNLLVVADQSSRDVVYAFPYEGSINDVSTYEHVFGRMKALDFDMTKMVLVTDRGYSSNFNANTCITNGGHFLCGYPIAARGDVERFVLSDKGKLLEQPLTYSTVYGLHSASFKSPWSNPNQTTVNVHTHVYRSDELAHLQRTELKKKLITTLDALNRGETIAHNQWPAVKALVRKVIDPNSNPHMQSETMWVPNTQEFDRRYALAGVFALRSNCLSDPIEALRLYRDRNCVETAFRFLKNGINGDRLGITNSSYYGKLLMLMIAVTIRLQVQQRYAQFLETTPAEHHRMPGNSFSLMIKELDEHLVHQRPKTKRWVPDMLSKRKKIWLKEIFGVCEPPRSFF